MSRVDLSVFRSPLPLSVRPCASSLSRSSQPATRASSTNPNSRRSRTGWHGADLTTLVNQQLAPYAAGTNITIAGPDIQLSASATQALAMVLYELVTNAVKYGALSLPGGGVSVSWDRKLNGHASRTVKLVWREFGGPPVAAPTQPSYGTDLIRNLIPHELGGSVDLAFASDGTCCKIEFPLEHVAEREVLLNPVTSSANS